MTDPALAQGNEPPLLAMRAITKAFGGVPALSGASLEVASGEVHALVQREDMRVPAPSKEKEWTPAHALIGGKIDPEYDESPLKGAIREAREETGADVDASGRIREALDELLELLRTQEDTKPVYVERSMYLVFPVREPDVAS